MGTEVFETCDALGRRRTVSFGHPPHDVHRFGVDLEPLPAAAEKLDMIGLVDIVPERLKVVPDCEVQEDARVVVGLHVDGATGFALEPPHRSGRLVAEPVEPVKVVDELGQTRIVVIEPGSGNVELGELPAAHGCRFSDGARIRGAASPRRRRCPPGRREQQHQPSSHRRQSRRPRPGPCRSGRSRSACRAPSR